MTEIRTVPVAACPVCGAAGPVVYRGLRDRAFHAPGSWDMRRCEACGSFWLDPRPTDDDLHLAYTSYFTHDRETPAPRSGPGLGPAFGRRIRAVRDAGTDDFIARRFGYPNGTPAWARTAALLVEVWPGRRLDAEFKVVRLHARDAGRLLDVGCGDGAVLAALRDRGWDVRGVDFDPAAVATARARNLSVDVGLLADQAYPPESFDVVTMSHFLEHVPDPGTVLEEVRRILRPGGRVVVLTPNAASWLHARYGPDWQPLEPPRHLQIFTPAALVELLSGAGFHGVEAVTTERSANGVARAAWKFRREGRWEMQSRPSLRERIPMEMIQLWEGWMIRRRPDAGEELVVVGTR